MHEKECCIPYIKLVREGSKVGWLFRWIEQVRQHGWWQGVILVGGAFSCGRVAASTWGE